MQGGWLQQQTGGLQRSNSAPDLRVLLATPLQPLLSIPQPVIAPPQYASASTAGALVPYKAPEARYSFLVQPYQVLAGCSRLQLWN